jgi:hypothetical protein
MIEKAEVRVLQRTSTSVVKDEITIQNKTQSVEKLFCRYCREELENVSEPEVLHPCR